MRGLAIGLFLIILVIFMVLLTTQRPDGDMQDNYQLDTAEASFDSTCSGRLDTCQGEK